MTNALIKVFVVFFRSDYIDNLNIYKFSSFGAIIYSIFELLSNSYFKLSFMENIPLAKDGLGWILPAIFFGIIGFLIKSKRVRSKV